MDPLDIYELTELENKARDAYMDKTDYDIRDWLSDNDYNRYIILNKKVNRYCIVCGDACTRFDQCRCTKGETTC